MRLFDCHSHWATDKGYIFRTPEERANQKRVFHTDFRLFTEQEQNDYFRQNNVRVLLDISWIKRLPLEEMIPYHDYIFDIQAKNRDVIYGQWLQFNPRLHGVAAVKEFKRCIEKNVGFVGLNVNGQVTGVSADQPEWEPFYKAAIETDTPVLIQVGLTGIGQGLPGGHGIVLEDGHPRTIDRVAARFPELKILAGRPAYPWQDDMIAILLHKPNVKYELHGWSPKHYTPSLKKEIRGRLRDRIMFGCDFPVLRYERVTADWRAEGYSEEVLEGVFHRNAEAYFPGAKPANAK